jgi:acyl-CoA reductase-like NAD-dependent aldehyde dehydrogenase
MGTIISPGHLQRIEDMIKHRKSGNILTGGVRMLGKSALDGFDFSKGSFFPPTVIGDVNVEDELWQEEIFGPVVVVKRFTVSAMLSLLMNLKLVITFMHRMRAKASPWQMLLDMV